MHIGYVLKRYPRYSETFIVAELLAHQAAGLDVEIFALADPGEAHRQPEVDLVRFPVTYLDDGGRGEGREARAAECLAALAGDRGVRLLHAHFATAATAMARSAARALGLPYTVTAHAKDIFHRDVARDELAAKLAGAARVVTVSEFNRRYLIEQIGLAGAQVVRIYNGLDLAAFPAQSGAPRNGRILAVGRLVEKKGFGDLISACGILAREQRLTGCDIVGVGPLEPELRAQVAMLGLSDFIHFHGALGRDRVGALMRQAGVFAAPCLVSGDGDRDGLPTVLIEAMASGIPVVATPVTGIPELVVDGLTGQIVPERHPRALAAALHQVGRDPLMAEMMARRARTRVERDFDGGPNAAVLRQVFVEAVDRHAALEGAA